MTQGTSSVEANVAAVKAMYEAFGRGDVPAILAHLADDVEWEKGRTSDEGVPYLIPGRGKQTVAAFFRSLGDVQFRRFAPLAVAGDGDVVMALIDVGLTTPSGIDVDDQEVHVWWFGADGLVTGFVHVIDTALHARASAGVPTGA